MNLNSLPNELQQWYDPEYCLSKVKQDPYAIRFIHNPSIEIQLEAIKQDPNSIQYIHNPSENVQLQAIKQDPNAIKYSIINNS